MPRSTKFEVVVLDRSGKVGGILALPPIGSPLLRPTPFAFALALLLTACGGSADAGPAAPGEPPASPLSEVATDGSAAAPSPGVEASSGAPAPATSTDAFESGLSVVSGAVCDELTERMPSFSARVGEEDPAAWAAAAGDTARWLAPEVSDATAATLLSFGDALEETPPADLPTSQDQRLSGGLQAIAEVLTGCTTR